VTVTAPVVLYVKTGCPFCATQREALAARGVTWREVNVSERPETVPELLKLTRGRRVVPVLVAGGRIEIAPGGGSRF
jgi:glutaredoxin 3